MTSNCFTSSHLPGFPGRVSVGTKASVDHLTADENTSFCFFLQLKAEKKLYDVMNQRLYLFPNLAVRLLLENSPQSQPEFRLLEPVNATTAAVQHRFIKPHKPLRSGIGRRLQRSPSEGWTHQTRRWGPQRDKPAQRGQSCLRTDNTLSTVWPSAAALWTEEGVPQKKYGVLQKPPHCKPSNFICVSNTVWTHKSFSLLGRRARERVGVTQRTSYLEPLEGPGWEVNYTVSFHRGCLKSAVNNGRC